MPIAAIAALLFAAIGASACGARYVRSATVPSHPLPLTSISRNVIVVSMDGLRPDAIATYGAPTLQRLIREGSYTLSASTSHGGDVDLVRSDEAGSTFVITLPSKNEP